MVGKLPKVVYQIRRGRDGLPTVVEKGLKGLPEVVTNKEVRDRMDRQVVQPLVGEVRGVQD